MAFGRITFNGVNADFGKDPMTLDIVPFRDKTRVMSTSISQNLNIASGFSVRAYYRNFLNANATDAALKTALFEAAQWAEAGLAWTFARDSSLVVNTTLDAGIAAGVTSIPVASATGIVSGSRYVIESETETAIVKATNSATDPVTISVATNYAFASGSRFRYFEFLPMLGMIKIIEQAPLHWDCSIEGIVDRRAL